MTQFRKEKKMIAYPIQINGVQTRVLQAGTAGDPIVFVHGTGGRADRWVRNIDAMASHGYRVYAFDLPGHGFATKGRGPDYSVPGYAKVLEAFLDHIGAAKAVIVGTSLGGHVVAHFAVNHPERIQAVVLSGSMGLVPIGAEARGRIQKGANNQTKDGVVEKLKRVIFDQKHVTEEFIEEEFQINNSPGAKESFQSLGEYIANRLDDDVVGERLAGLASRFKTLLIWGAEDKTVSLAVGETAHGMLKAPLVSIAGAAHTSYYEEAEAFNAVLLDFLKGQLGRHAAAGVTYAM
jgi:pimeloyl-ACP methyl ester carboxylesterase